MMTLTALATYCETDSSAPSGVIVTCAIALIFLSPFGLLKILLSSITQTQEVKKMSKVKNVTINFFQMFSSDGMFFDNLSAKLANMFDNGVTHGFFDTGTRELMFKIFYKHDIGGGDAFVVGLVKERDQWPVWFSSEGELDDIPLERGMLGDISFALIIPEKMVLTTLSGGVGSPTPASFVYFMRWLTDDESAGIQPVFVPDAYEQVRDWEMYRKLTMSVEAPTNDFVQEVLTTETGKDLSLMETLNGLRIDISVSMGHNKGSLDVGQVKKFISGLISENYARKLVLTGKSFDGQKAGEYDLYNARLKQKAEIRMNGTTLNAEDAASAMVNAYFNNQDHMENLEPIIPETDEED